MVKYENECAGCGLPCLYENCRYYKVEKHYCDRCTSPAIAEVDGEELCEDHANEQLNKWFDELLISEKCEVLDVEYRRVE